MADITRDDVRQAVRDELSNVLHSIQDTVERLDQRTNNFDEVQRDIRDIHQRLSAVLPGLENQARYSETNTSSINDIKLRVQNIERGMAQLVQYLHLTTQEDADNSKN